MVCAAGRDRKTTGRFCKIDATAIKAVAKFSRQTGASSVGNGPQITAAGVISRSIRTWSVVRKNVGVRAKAGSAVSLYRVGRRRLSTSVTNKSSAVVLTLAFLRRFDR